MSRISAPDAIALAAQAAGKSWANAVRTGLQADGRDEGMWPGTLSEARALAARIIGEHKTPEDAHEDVARAVYAAARSSWNANRGTARGSRRAGRSKGPTGEG